MEKEPRKWKVLERTEVEARKTQDMTESPEEEVPTPWAQTQKKPSSPTLHQETLMAKLQGLPKRSRKGRRAPEEEHLAESRQEDTFAEEPPKVDCQG